jgi:hypothetical protein
LRIVASRCHAVKRRPYAKKARFATHQGGTELLEQKLIVGRFINLNIPAPQIQPYAPGDFVLVPVTECYLQESHGIFTKTSDVQIGSGPKQHRNFHWLPWLPGAISETALVGADVLTGPMSGCWLVSRRRPNGVPHAGHLGTTIDNPVATAAVNIAWNNFATANAADVIGGFNPFRHWNGAYPAQQVGEGAPRFFGLYTTSNDYYVVIAYQQNNPVTLLRIAGIQQVPSSTLGRLQHVDLPGP